MSDDETRRQAVREAAFRSTGLPGRSPDKTWGGHSSGGRCAICREEINAGEFEWELEFSGDDRPSADRFLVHPRCLTSWELQRQVLAHEFEAQSDRRSVEQTSQNGREPRISGEHGGGVSLPAVRHGANIGAHDTAGGREKASS